MGNQYSYPEAKSNQESLKNQVSSVASQMQAIKGVVSNFLNVENFGGETQRQIKAFMSEVVLGGIEASNLLIENVEMQHQNLINRFKGIDGADDTVIYDSRLTIASQQNDEYAKVLLDKANEINNLIAQANTQGVSGKKYDTGEIGIHQNTINTGLKELNQSLTNQGNIVNEATNLDQFINSVRQFINFMGTCQPSTYNAGALAGQPFYKPYFEHAIESLKTKEDTYFVQKKIAEMGSITQIAYANRIEKYIEEGEQTNNHSEKIDNLVELAYELGGADKVKEQASFLLDMAKYQTMKYDLNPNKTSVEALNSLKKAKQFGMIGIMLTGAATDIINVKKREVERQIGQSQVHTNTEILQDYIDINYTEGSGTISYQSIKTVEMSSDSGVHAEIGAGKTTITYDKETLNVDTYSIDSTLGAIKISGDAKNGLTKDAVKEMNEVLVQSLATGLVLELVLSDLPIAGTVLGATTSASETYKTQLLLNETGLQMQQTNFMSTFGFDGGAFKNAEGEVKGIVISPSIQTEKMLAKYRQITGDTKMTSKYLTTSEGMNDMTKSLTDPNNPYNKKLRDAVSQFNNGEYNENIVEYLKI